MAEIDYCPKCDCLVRQYSGKCLVCESKTITMFVDTEKNTWPMLLAIIFGTAFIFILLILNIMDSMAWTVIVSTAVLSIILFGSTYFMWKTHKPLMDGALERGRKLYSEHIREYDAGENIIDHSMPPPATRYPWSIRNIHKLRTALIVTIILTPMPMLLGLFVLRPASTSGTLTISFLTTAFIVAAIMIHTGYRPAKRHYELIDAMKLEPGEVQKSFKSLTVKSKMYGDFELDYDSDYGYHLKMNLDSDIAKHVPKMDIWTRPNMISRLRKKTTDQAPGFQWMNSVQFEAIKSLKLIKVEEVFHNKRIFAALDDKALYSETGDIVSVVRLLREIKYNLESKYSDQLDK